MTTTATDGKVALNTSFMLSASATSFETRSIVPQSPAFPAAVAGVYAPTFVTTLANTVFSCASPVYTTTSSSQPIISQAVNLNTPNTSIVSRPSCSDRVNTILVDAAVIDNNVIADAIRAMANSIIDSSARISAMEKSPSSFTATASEYFKRTAALENRVDVLDRGNAAQIRASRDALASARAAERVYVSDQLRVVEMPRADLNVVQRAFKKIAAKFSISIPVDSVTAVRPCSVSTPADPSGPDELLSPAAAAQSRRNPDVFVTLKFAELRDLLLSNFKSNGSVRISDIDPTVRSMPECDGEIRIYEVLAPA